MIAFKEQTEIEMFFLPADLRKGQKKRFRMLSHTKWDLSTENWFSLFLAVHHYSFSHYLVLCQLKVLVWQQSIRLRKVFSLNFSFVMVDSFSVNKMLLHCRVEDKWYSECENWCNKFCDLERYSYISWMVRLYHYWDTNMWHLPSKLSGEVSNALVLLTSTASITVSSASMTKAVSTH